MHSSSHQLFFFEEFANLKNILGDHFYKLRGFQQPKGVSLLSQKEESVGKELKAVRDLEVLTKLRMKEFNAEKQFESLSS